MKIKFTGILAAVAGVGILILNTSTYGSINLGEPVPDVAPNCGMPCKDGICLPATVAIPKPSASAVVVTSDQSRVASTKAIATTNNAPVNGSSAEAAAIRIICGNEVDPGLNNGKNGSVLDLVGKNAAQGSPILNVPVMDDLQPDQVFTANDAPFRPSRTSFYTTEEVKTPAIQTGELIFGAP